MSLREEKEKQLTLIRLTYILLRSHLLSLARLLHDQRDLHLGIEPNIAVTHDMHNKRVVTGLRRRLELRLERLHRKRRRLSVRLKHGAIELRKGKWRNCHAALLGVRQEHMPPRAVVAR